MPRHEHSAEDIAAKVEEFSAISEIKAVHRATGERMTFTRAWFEEEIARPGDLNKIFTTDEDAFMQLPDIMSICRNVRDTYNLKTAWLTFQVFFLPPADPDMRPMEYRNEKDWGDLRVSIPPLQNSH